MQKGKEKTSKIRIQKYLSENGIASRRKAEDMVKSGQIKVNGQIASIGQKVVAGKDKVSVNGKLVHLNKNPKKYIMLNKPRGYITTMHDEKGRKCVADLVKDVQDRIWPIGRLDKESEGLLIMTNDGEFANKIAHPSKHVGKVYRVTIKPSISDSQIAKMCEGMEIDGYKTEPAFVNIVAEESDRVVVEITIFEGRNRQIRKMCEKLNLNVARLKRVSIGGIALGGLPVGKWRYLKNDEIKRLSGN